MTKTIAEYFIQEGEERGEKRGKQSGKVEAKREDILRLLQLRFDTVPPTVVRRVKSMRRMDRLAALFDKAATAKDISEIERD